MSQDKPLPFVYQFAAGAVAGVSEVRATRPLQCLQRNGRKLIMSSIADPGDVGQNEAPPINPVQLTES